MGTGGGIRRIPVLVILVPAVLAMAGGGYALARALRSSPPATNGAGSRPASTGYHGAAGGHAAAPSGSTTHSGSSTGVSTPLCSDSSAVVRVSSQEGAAGTISTVWQVKNTSSTACHSYGYPGMDFRGKSGWMNVQVHRGGGMNNVNQTPTAIVVRPGASLYFVSDWSDVTTNVGNCQTFDRVKVTQPDNTASVQKASSGCLIPTSVYLGPVTSSPTA